MIYKTVTNPKSTEKTQRFRGTPVLFGVVADIISFSKVSPDSAELLLSSLLVVLVIASFVAVSHRPALSPQFTSPAFSFPLHTFADAVRDDF
jgi:hypothetical protein